MGRIACVLAVAALLVFAGARLSPAQDLGGISVSPTRVVLAGRARSAEVLLINRGSEAATYRVTFENRRMTEDGKLETVTQPDPGQFFADGMIRYSPRQVEVPAGGVQSVRLLLRRPAGLAPGEYRSHMVFTSVPPPRVGTNIDPGDLAPGEIRIEFIPTYVITIPVIVRQGEPSATASLSDLKLEPAAEGAPPVLSLRINRSGDRSTYGDIVATQGETEMGALRGVVVYTPNPSRLIKLRLNPPEGASLTGASLHVVYRAKAEEGGEVLAEAELPLP